MKPTINVLSTTIISVCTSINKGDLLYQQPYFVKSTDVRYTVCHHTFYEDLTMNIYVQNRQRSNVEICNSLVGEAKAGSMPAPL